MAPQSSARGTVCLPGTWLHNKPMRCSSKEVPLRICMEKVATPNATCLRFLGVSRLPPDPSEATSKLLLAHSLKPLLSHILASVPVTWQQTAGKQHWISVPKFLRQCHKVIGFLPVCVIDQAVAGTFPQFVLPGGQGPLVATYTEKLIGKRTIRKQVKFVDGSTNKKVQCTRSREIFLIS